MLIYLILHCIFQVSITYNHHPIIGVIAFPSEIEAFNYSIPSSYVKWIEDAGV